MPCINHSALRRRYDAAMKDGAPHRFFADVRSALSSGELNPGEFSVRRLFESFVDGGRELIASWGEDRESGYSVTALESASAVSTATFSNIIGQIVVSAVLEKFSAPDLLFDRLVTVIPTNFNGEKIPGVGGVGDRIEVVGESEAYPLIGLSETYVETPQTVKRGGILGLTKEIIQQDRTGVLMQEAGKIAESIAVNREKRVLDVVCGVVNNHKYNGTSYNTYNASTPWGNLVTSNALVDWTDIEAVMLKFDAMTDLATGEPVLIPATSLIVPSALAWTAKRIVEATTIRHNDGASNTPQSEGPNLVPTLSVLSNAYVANRTSSSTTWFIGNPKKAFAYMQNWGPKVDVAPANSEQEFTNDIVKRWKISERGVCCPIYPQAMVKATA